MDFTSEDTQALEKLVAYGREYALNVAGATVRRSSSRLCLGVEHGDYNGTALFGVGTDRFIWLAYKPNETDQVRIFSGNFPDEGVIQFTAGKAPAATDANADGWERFPYGVDTILAQAGYELKRGFDAVLFGNIPGGGMSRSASLCLNLILTMLEVNELSEEDGFKVVKLAQQVENDYIGSPCGILDQTMIYFAKAGQGTYYDPAAGTIKYVPLGRDAIDFRFVVMDTGTKRPGLEKSTYKIRRGECEAFLRTLQGGGFDIQSLADVRDQAMFDRIRQQFGASHRDGFDRLDYIFHAQQRFGRMMAAWESGDIETVGKVFREDGLGLRDTYKISGPELEMMCDIARQVPGVLGERMLGGGDKGASGAIVKAGAVDDLRWAVGDEYPRKCPEYADAYAVHVCRQVDGIVVMPEPLK